MDFSVSTEPNALLVASDDLGTAEVSGAESDGEVLGFGVLHLRVNLANESHLEVEDGATAD